MKSSFFRLALAAMLFAAAPVSHAALLEFHTFLSGANESPPNASPGTGTAVIDVDTLANTMRVQVTFADLLAPNTSAHIHCCTATPFAGTAMVATTTPTFTGFPAGSTSGTYDHTFDLTLASSYNPAFVTAHGNSIAQAEADLIAGMIAGTTYLNIHTPLPLGVPGGEIRGFLTPEPASTALFGLGLAALAFGFRSKAGRR